MDVICPVFCCLGSNIALKVRFRATYTEELRHLHPKENPTRSASRQLVMLGKSVNFSEAQFCNSTNHQLQSHNYKTSSSTLNPWPLLSQPLRPSFPSSSLSLKPLTPRGNRFLPQPDKNSLAKIYLDVIT